MAFSLLLTAAHPTLPRHLGTAAFASLSAAASTHQRKLQHRRLRPLKARAGATAAALCRLLPLPLPLSCLSSCELNCHRCLCYSQVEAYTMAAAADDHSKEWVVPPNDDGATLCPACSGWRLFSASPPFGAFAMLGAALHASKGL